MAGQLEYSSTAASNTAINGIGIAGSNTIKNGDDAMRQMMADTAASITKVVDKAAGTYTAVKGDYNQLWRATGAVTINLTAAATLTSGWCLWVKGDGGAITVDPAGAELINGAATLSLPDGKSAIILCTGTAFRAVVFGTLGTSDIGVSIQAYDALLTAIAGLTTANGKFLAFTGVDTAAVRDIVGTVSQVGGIPTGAIVESGSNANGTYVRYADGTQICGGTTSAQTTDTVYSGTMYYNGTVSEGTFPAVFSVAPQVIANAVRSDGVGSGRITGSFVTSTSTTMTGGIRSVSHATGHGVSHKYIAIGRWF